MSGASGRARLLDNRKLVNQFASLERRTSSGALVNVTLPGPPIAVFGVYGNFGSNRFGYSDGPGDNSAGSVYASRPPEFWAAQGIFHPSDRQMWIDRGVYKPPEIKEKSS